MNMIVSKEITDDQQLRAQVARATQVLEEIAGRTAEPVTVNWSRHNERGFHFIHLELSDSTGANAATLFSGPAELNQESYLRARLYRIWGDLLQDRSHKQLNQLSGSADVSRP
jgi:hypothetical protein